MSGRPFAPSRRAVAALALQGLLPWFAPWLVPSAARAAAQDPNDGADRGLGGTGARLADAPGAVPGGPDETLGQDRGIGGTGVIGTIRRFGSIVVNDLRVTFPPGVAVSIDGRRAAVRDLRLGHVVRVLARRRGGVLVTRAIVAESEVVGPVDAAGAGHLTVLGQRIVLAEGVAAPPRRAGARLAVSGLRRLDGAVVASLIEARPPGPDLLRGPVEAGADGKLAVGGLAVAGLDPGLLGRRVSLAGARRGGIFHPHAVTVEPRIPFAAAEAVSLEAYVARAPDGLRLGSGLDVSAEPDALAEVGEGAVRAVVLARPDASGRLDARSLHVEAGARGGEQGVPGRPAGPGEPALGRAEPGRPDAGRSDAGPRGGAGGGPGGSAGPGGAGGRGGPGGGGAGSGGRGGGPGR